MTIICLSTRAKKYFTFLVHTLSTLLTGFSELYGVSVEGVKGGYIQEGGTAEPKIKFFTARCS